MINTSAFLRNLFSFAVILPAAVLCYLPMRDRRRLSPPRLTLLFIIVYSVLTAGASYLICRFGLDSSTVFYPMLVILFLLYHATLRVDLSRSLCVFFSVCAFMSFVSNTAAAMECLLCPQVSRNTGSVVNTLFQLGLGTLGVIFLFYPLVHYGIRLINEFPVRQTWYVITWLMGGFLLVNIALCPSYYSILRTGTVFVSYCSLLAMLFTLQLATFFFFYQIVMTTMELEAQRRKAQLMEIQEVQVKKLQDYISETSRLRHDFRHTIVSLTGMANAGDFDGIRDFLKRYTGEMPVSEVTNYCASPAVNAALNYFAQAAQSMGVKLQWRIDLPEDCPVPDVDLGGILSNILENAVRACENVPEEDRSIRLTVTTLDEPNLYIVAANSFDGNVRLQGDRYLSTRKNGTGLGLASIAITAKKYGGSARFHHKGCVFCTDVRIPLDASGGTAALARRTQEKAAPQM